jgi:hypothetical protein
MPQDLKQAFLSKAVAAYHVKLIATIKAICQRAGIGVTNDAVNSMAYKMAASGSGVASQLSFKEYLRMVDMGVGRGHPLGGLRATVVTLQSRNKSGLAQIKDRVRKPKTFIYSKTAYGQLNGLINDLLFGYTEEAIAILKTELSLAA